MTLSGNSALRSFVKGVRASILQGAVSATDPLELFLDAIFGPRPGAAIQLPKAKQMWDAFTEQAPTPELVAAYREHFPLFVRDRYGELLRPAWSKPSRAAAFSLLRRNVDDHDAWRYLSLRFGFSPGAVGPMSDEKIGSLISRDVRVVSFSCSRAISTIRASRDAGVLELLSGRTA